MSSYGPIRSSKTHEARMESPYEKQDLDTFKHWGVKFDIHGLLSCKDDENYDLKKKSYEQVSEGWADYRDHCIKILETFLTKARTFEAKHDWAKITHYSVIMFSNEHDCHGRYIIPVADLTTEDKALASVRGWVASEYDTIEDSILVQWLQARLKKWKKYQVVLNNGDEPKVIETRILEIQYYD